MKLTQGPMAGVRSHGWRCSFPDQMASSDRHAFPSTPVERPLAKGTGERGTNSQKLHQRGFLLHHAFASDANYRRLRVKHPKPGQQKDRCGRQCLAKGNVD